MPFSLACLPRGLEWFVKNSPLGYTQIRCTHPLVAVSGQFDEEDGQNAGTSASCPPVIKRIKKNVCNTKHNKGLLLSTIIQQEKFNSITLITGSMLPMNLLQPFSPFFIISFNDVSENLVVCHKNIPLIKVYLLSRSNQ